MKATIKQNALRYIWSDRQGKKRAEVVYNVLLNNKRLNLGDYTQFLEDFNSKWRGYYSVAFQQWEQERLITRSKGVYKITPLGEAYVNNPRVLRQVNEIKEHHEHKRTELLIEYRELQRRFDRLVNSLDRLIINA